MDDPVGRYVSFFVRRRGIIVAGLVLVTVVVGSGIVVSGTQFSVSQFQVDSPEQEAYTEVQSAFPTDNRSYSQVVVRADDDTMSKERLLQTMELQRALRSNETVNKTLANEQPTVGNAIAIGSAPRRVRLLNGDDSADGREDRLE